jgi:hypothetical protein
MLNQAHGYLKIKVRLSKHCDMKAYWDGWGLHKFVTSKMDGDELSLHALAALTIAEGTRGTHMKWNSRTPESQSWHVQ